MSAEENKQRVRRFFQAMCEGDMDTMVGSYAENGDVRTMGNTLISNTHTKSEIAEYAGQIYEAFPAGITFTIKAMTAEGDRVAVEATSHGDHVSGKVYENDYHFLFEFVDGKILHLREYLDTEKVTEVLCGGQRPA